MPFIDFNRLSRDFTQYPVTTKNPPTKEDLDYLYTFFLTREQIATILNTKLHVLKMHIKDLKAKNPYRYKPLDRDFLFDLYINKNLSLLEIEKITHKSATTLHKYMKKYGIAKDMSLIVSLRERTCNERYKHKNPSQVDFIKERKAATCRKNRGTDYPTQSKEVLGTRYRNNEIKYGVGSARQRHIGKEKVAILKSKEKLLATMKEHNLFSTRQVSRFFGISNKSAYNYIKKHGLMSILKHHASSYEQDIKDSLKSVLLKKDRTILDGKEIDLYSAEHKIGIEFNGDYWHSDAIKEKDYHYNKSKLAESKGVFIYHVFEYEWYNKITRNKILSQLNHIFGLTTNRLYARKCSIKKISVKDKKAFLTTNHLQGDNISTINLGLYYEDALVFVMTFKYLGEDTYELSRFCSKLGYNIIGGASKLFKYFLKTYKPKSIISYSDIGKAKGEVYTILGFHRAEIIEPDYLWSKNFTAVSFSQYKKRKGIAEESLTKTEDQIMRERLFKRLYDCGKQKWVWIT